jgi:ankyrin repeat protein
VTTSDPFDQLSKCIKRGDVIGVRALVASGVSVDSRNRFGWTPLMLAAGSGNTSIVDYLLSAGASVGAINNFGASPIAYATLSGECSVIESLLRAGAPIDVKPHGVTLLEFAERGGGRHKTRRHFDLLREAGAS